MTKQQAVDIFGSVKELAKLLNVTPQAIYQWPDNLEQPTIDRIVGAAVRAGKCWHQQDSHQAGNQTNAA